MWLLQKSASVVSSRRTTAEADLREFVDGVDVGDDGVMARAFQSLVVKSGAGAPVDHRRFGHRDRAERLSRLQSGHDPRHVRDQALRQVADLGARVGDDLLARTVIELLRHLERLAGKPAEARAAEFLQRRKIVQLGDPCRLSSTRTDSSPSKSRGIGDSLGHLAPDNPFLRRMPQAARPHGQADRDSRNHALALAPS